MNRSHTIKTLLANLMGLKEVNKDKMEKELDEALAKYN